MCYPVFNVFPQVIESAHVMSFVSRECAQCGQPNHCRRNACSCCSANLRASGQPSGTTHGAGYNVGGRPSGTTHEAGYNVTRRGGQPSGTTHEAMLLVVVVDRVVLLTKQGTMLLVVVVNRVVGERQLQFMIPLSFLLTGMFQNK